jgi:hypothetical protein
MIYHHVGWQGLEGVCLLREVGAITCCRVVDRPRERDISGADYRNREYSLPFLNALPSSPRRGHVRELYFTEGYSGLYEHSMDLVGGFSIIGIWARLH